MWKYKFTVVTRMSENEPDGSCPTLREVLVVHARNRLDARRNVLEKVWGRDMLVTRFVACVAKRVGK